MKCLLKLLLVLVLLFSQNILAQNFEIGIEGGVQFLNKPKDVMPFLPDDYSFGSNLQIGAVVKYNFMVLPIKLTGKIIYTDIDSKEFQESKFIEGRARGSVPGDILFKSSLISMQIGGEYYIITGIVSPFINTNLQFNFIDNFEYSFTPTQSISVDKSVITRENGMRVGLGIGGGIELSVIENINICFDLSYNFYNLINKNDSLEYELENATVLGDIDNEEKTINAMHLGLSILYKL